MSALAWITFIICAVAVALHYHATGDERFLLFAIPGLVMLIVIPFTLAWMSRRSYVRAAENVGGTARFIKMDRINRGMTGTVLRTAGRVERITFRWLNRPHFHLREGSAGIRVIMFTSPEQNIRVGDRVAVLGIVMKNLFSGKDPVISAVSIEKTTD
ncbi:MAG: hypothetical protein JXO48_09780 [Deltaproteobacteria bacterium]|nr:hypothetical protein [Deltaproteobacteria bacterium]